MTLHTYIFRIFLAIALLIFLFFGVFYVSWVGVIGSDDQVYIENARFRIYEPFVVGQNHWEVRLTLTVPMALAFAMFGESEISAALPTLFYTFLTGLIVFLFLAERITLTTSFLVAALIATSPLLAINATSLRIDAVETFFVTTSLVFFISAIERKLSVIFLLAGILCGLAFVTRPTAVALLLFYMMLFLIRYRVPRHHYILVFLGFGLVWLAESLYYFVSTGEFFYRLAVDFNHDHVVRGGSLFGAVVVEPMKMLLGSHNLGLVFWCLPVATWYLARCQSVQSHTRKIAVFFSLFSVTWIVVFSGFASKLALDPRYLSPALTASMVVIGMFIGALIESRRHIIALCIVFIFFMNHALAIYVENKDFSYSQRWLNVLAVKYNEPIYTDPQTYGRALFLLELSGVEGEVFAAPAPAGGLFLAVPQNAQRGSYNGVHWNPDDYNVGDWPLVEKLDPGRRRIGIVLDAAGLSDFIPASIWRKINNPNPPVFLYRSP